jgi:hypothetical protein
MKRLDEIDSNSETRGYAYEVDSLPFRHSTEQKNRVDGSVAKKMCVGAVVMAAFVAIISIRVMVATYGDDAKIDPLIATVTLLSSSIIGAMLGATLALKDCIHRKISDGERVSVVHRLLFGYGFRSLAAWICIVFFICMVVLPILLTIRPF